MTVKLEDFVANSLVQIVRGVEKAQEQLDGSDAKVSPSMQTLADKNSIGRADGADNLQPVYNVTFDVAVVGTEDEKTAGGVGVVLGAFALGSKGESSEGTAQTSRIQFKVPILLPSHGES